MTWQQCSRVISKSGTLRRILCRGEWLGEHEAETSDGAAETERTGRKEKEEKGEGRREEKEEQGERCEKCSVLFIQIFVLGASVTLATRVLSVGWFCACAVILAEPGISAWAKCWRLGVCLHCQVFLFAFSVKKDDSLFLSEADRKLLEKWKTMQTHSRTGSDPDSKPFVPHHVRSASSGSNVSEHSNVSSPMPQAAIAHQQIPQAPRVQPENLTHFRTVVPPSVVSTQADQATNGANVLVGSNSGSTKNELGMGHPMAPLPFAASAAAAARLPDFQVPDPVLQPPPDPVPLPFASYIKTEPTQRAEATPQAPELHVVAPPPGFPVRSGSLASQNLAAVAAAASILPSYTEALRAKMSTSPPMVHTFATRSTDQASFFAQFCAHRPSMCRTFSYTVSITLSGVCAGRKLLRPHKIVAIANV